VAIVQARMLSTRLPGKVLLSVAGKTLLERMLERLTRAAQLDGLVVATTDSAADQAIARVAARAGLRCVSGHPTDLVDRHLAAARATRADVIVKIPSDCPLIDPAIVDRVVSTFRQGVSPLDYLSNLHPATWPDGNDVEVFTREALETAFVEADRPYEREHTTPFIWDQPGRFRVANVEWSGGRDLSGSHRLTVDYPEDLALVSAVIAAFEAEGRDRFSSDDIVAFLDRNPAVRELNARHRCTGWPWDHAQVLRTRRPAVHPAQPLQSEP
jgi:spore coat polysaccharide biosynthesis protein SpsF